VGASSSQLVLFARGKIWIWKLEAGSSKKSISELSTTVNVEFSFSQYTLSSTKELPL